MNHDKYVKYPRTPHLHWSTASGDDRMLKNDSHLVGKKVVVTIKMDGENTTIYKDYIHARSIDSLAHPSQSHVRALQGSVGYLLDEDERICGENLYARHTIPYKDLKSYFYGISYWKSDDYLQKNTCMSWGDTLARFKELGITPVEEIYNGVYDAEKIQESFEPFKTTHEGYVLRLTKAFDRDMFDSSTGKYVRSEFKQTLNATNKHWREGKIECNELVENEREVKNNK